MDDLGRIYSNPTTQNQDILYGGFRGYYIQIKRVENHPLLEYSNWDELYDDAAKLLLLTLKDRGKKCYAILKALISTQNFSPIQQGYIAKKRLLLKQADQLLGYHATVRPSYGNIDDLESMGLLFDISGKDRVVALPEELYPLAMKIIA